METMKQSGPWSSLRSESASGGYIFAVVVMYLTLKVKKKKEKN